MRPAWHALDLADVLTALEGNPDRGLDDTEVAARRSRYGDNVLPQALRRPPLRLLLAQFTDVMVLVLLAAAALASVVGELEDSTAIVAIVLLNALLGFVQEYRAERAMAALGALAAPLARVRRAGIERLVPAATLVPGDLVVLEAGQMVPADLRLVAVHHLRVEEAALTGESIPIAKQVGAAMSETQPLGDRVGMAFQGTLISAGRGTGLVVATGRQTELGRIAALLRDTPEVRTPLQRRLGVFGRKLALLVSALCVVMFVAGLLRGEPIGLMFMTALSLAVAAIPEALPAMITLALALGARRLAHRQALIRRLPAVETLGSVTYIGADKTGTLTENRMQVAAVHDVDGVTIPLTERADQPMALAECLALCTDVTRAADGRLVGDPTETALVHAAQEAGVDLRTIHAAWPRLAEVPFTADRARMTTVHAAAGGTLHVVCTKGAPEQVVLGCRSMRRHGRTVPMDPAHVLWQAQQMAASGLRVLAVAMRATGEAPSTASSTRETVSAYETDLTLLALVGLWDPPRAEAREAVRTCQAAGIRVIMITGDHPATARAIAERLGLVTPRDEVLTGAELAALDDASLAGRVTQVRVYARVAPEDKLRIVRALQAHGEFVAMTGDGVNDAPALRQADIGVAMGRGGTDVAREAAHLVLLDDNFATIVSAVREGRRIYDNIRRFIRFVLSTNAGELWTLFLAPIIGLPLPLLPIHILWMNLVTDGLPGLALSAEPAEPTAMRRPPRPPAEGVFAHGLWQHAVWVGLLMALLALGTQAWAVQHAPAQGQTMIFLVLTLAQLAHVLAIRSETQPLWRLGWWSNPWLLGAVTLTFVLQLLTVYLPGMRRVFRTEALSTGQLAACVALASIVYVAVELEKILIRRRGLYGITGHVASRGRSPEP